MRFLQTLSDIEFSHFETSKLTATSIPRRSEIPVNLTAHFPVLLKEVKLQVQTAN